MKIKPLTQLREMLSKALSGQTNLNKSIQSFFIETMELILTHKGRLNFTQMARCGRSCESRFRQNFKKAFDWFKFNKSFLESAKGRCIAIAIDSCYISKSGKRTPGLDCFWSGCAAAMKRGPEILGISIADADANDAIFLKAEQTFTGKKRQAPRYSSPRTSICPHGISSTFTGQGFSWSSSLRCQAVHRPHSLSGEEQGGIVFRLQRFPHVRQRRHSLRTAARIESLRRFGKNPATQCRNAVLIYCNVREIPEHAIK